MSTFFGLMFYNLVSILSLVGREGEDSFTDFCGLYPFDLYPASA